MSDVSSARFDQAHGERAARRVAELRAAREAGMQRLRVILNGKPLGAIRLDRLPDFCACITGGPK